MHGPASSQVPDTDTHVHKFPERGQSVPMSKHEAVRKFLGMMILRERA